MTLSVVFVSAAAIALPVLGLVRHRAHRRRVLAELAATRDVITSAFPIDIAADADRATLTAAFARERLARVDGFLAAGCLAELRAEAEANIPRMTHSHLPGHKKGRTLSYEAIQRDAPGCLAFYHSPAVVDWMSAITGVRLRQTPDADQSSLSVLCYKDEGDHINWHFDHNFYRGRHFTVLLSLAN
jgi:hypothetical protein